MKNGKSEISQFFKPLVEKNQSVQSNGVSSNGHVESRLSPMKTGFKSGHGVGGAISSDGGDENDDEDEEAMRPSPKKLRKKSNQQQFKSSDEDDEQLPQRRRSTRVRKPVLIPPKANDEDIENNQPNPDNQNHQQQQQKQQLPKKKARSRNASSPGGSLSARQRKPPVHRQRKAKPKGEKPKADPNRIRSGYVFSTDSLEASSTTQYESSEEEIAEYIETKKESKKAQTDIDSDVSSIVSHIEVLTSSSEDEDNDEFNLETYQVQEPTHNDLTLDCRQITRDRSISEDMTDDDEIEQLLCELEQRTSCVNVRTTWEYICSRTGEENEQLTKLYRPRHIEEQLIDQARAATNDSIAMIVEWFKGWRTFIDNRNQENVEHSQDSQGSDSWQGSIDEDQTASSLFLHGHSGVGKSSLVHACSEMFNFNVIEVHAGQERNGTMIRETLKEATQSERVQKKRKQPMSSFFKPKSQKEPKIEEIVEKEKNDSLLLFSGVDLLFETKDEGFWGALKKISETTKIPIIFTADTVDANTGMNPENSSSRREFDDFDFKEKCKEIYIHRTRAADAIAYIRMISLHQGFKLTHEAASNLVHYSLSYRQCLLNLQLWANAFPRRSNGPEPVAALISSELSLSLCASSQHCHPSTLDVLYQASIPFIAQNRWNLISGPKLEKKKRKKKKTDLKQLSSYLSTISLFDRASTLDQEVRVNARSDCYRGRADVEDTTPVSQTFERARELRCWGETLALQQTETRVETGNERSELHFATYHAKNNALATDSMEDRVIESGLEMDGFISINCQLHTEWYTAGIRKWSGDYAPAIRALVRHETSQDRHKSSGQGSRRSRKMDNAFGADFWSQKYGFDFDDDEIVKFKSVFEEAD